MKHLYNAVAVIGTYKKGDEVKKVYRTIAKVFEGTHGPFMVMDATFTAAGLVKRDDGSVSVSLYPPREEEATKPAAQPARDADFNDDIGF